MRKIQLIPISQIRVINPRVRDKHGHREIVENIGQIGLKRPITVARRIGTPNTYDLVCGQGRIQAYQALGWAEIPAVVVDAEECDCLVMSLVENIARRHRSSVELMRDIRSLLDRGYSEADIARKLGVAASWVGSIAGLLANGEDRLIEAVDRGLIPVSLAATIAKSGDVELQEALEDAYTQGILRGRKLVMLKRLLDRRSLHGRSRGNTNPVPRVDKKMNAERLRQIYQREVGKLHILVKKADVTQKRLLFVVQAVRTLLSEPEFVSLLKSEGIDSIPKSLEQRIHLGHQNEH